MIQGLIIFIMFIQIKSNNQHKIYFFADKRNSDDKTKTNE